MLRKITITIFTVLLLLFFFSNNSSALSYDNMFLTCVYQGDTSTVFGSLPNYDLSYYDLTKSFVYYSGGRSVIFLCPSTVTEDVTGQIIYRYESGGSTTIINNTNISFQYVSANRRGNGWEGNGTFAPSSSYSAPYAPADSFTPFTYVGSNINISYEGSNVINFPGGFYSCTLAITNSNTDIASGQETVSINLSNSSLALGDSSHPAFIQCLVKTANDSDFRELSSVILTNNSSLYNSETETFSIPLANLINEDLSVDDEIRLYYGWSIQDYLGTWHAYEYFNTYTRTTAYDSSSYTPAPSPDSGGSDEPSSPDYTNSLDNIQSSIDSQTSAINQQTNSINNMNDNLMNQNVTNPSSIDIQDNTQDNTADLSNFFSNIQNAFTSRDSTDKSFTLTLPNGDNFTFTFPKTFIRSIITSNSVLYTFLSSFWYIVFGVYIVFDLKKMYNKFKNGDFESAMNSSSVDNVVKEALR